MKAAITAVAGYVPDDVLTNADLEKLVDTNDEWIRTRTGIRERHILKDPNLATSDMAAEAAKKLLEKKGMSPEEIDLIVVATVTADMHFPSTANLVADKIGAVNSWGFDISAACSGFLFSLQTAVQFIEAGTHKKSVGDRCRQNEFNH